MLLKIKAFIYRFSAIFGKRIYLAQKEEDKYFAKQRFVKTVMDIISEDDKEDFIIRLHIGLWHVDNGFTTVYTGHLTRFKAIKETLIHAFKG